MTLETCWELSKLWYSDRLDPDWQPKSAKRITKILGAVGLEGVFWTPGS